MAEQEDSYNLNNNLEETYNNQDDEFEDSIQKSPEKGGKAGEKPDEPAEQLKVDNPKTQSYIESLSEYDKNRYRILEEKNERLNQELRNLIDSTEMILNKETERRRKRNVYEEPADVTEKKQKLKVKQNEVSEIKTRIQHKKKQLYSNFNTPLVREKEDELKNLRQIYAKRYKEKASIEKIMNQQKNALEDHVQNLESEEVQGKAYDDLRQFKEKNRKLFDEISTQEKTLKKNHEKVVDLKLFIRNFQKKFENSQNNAKQDKITQQSVESLEKEMEDLKKQLSEEKKEYKEQVKILDKPRYDQNKITTEQEDKIKLRDKEIRVYKLKLKEIQRLVRVKAVKPNRNPPPESEQDKVNNKPPNFEFTTNQNENSKVEDQGNNENSTNK